MNNNKRKLIKELLKSSREINKISFKLADIRYFLDKMDLNEENEKSIKEFIETINKNNSDIMDLIYYWKDKMADASKNKTNESEID